jgi:1,5-anhydro-D-fructose reductase (1,5-anhydro-D-mannitol-forming)
MSTRAAAGRAGAPTLRWALVGASDIAATRVLPARRRLGHVVVVVTSADPARARANARRHDIPRATTSVDEAVGAGVDAVYVSTTNDLHAAQAGVALAAGRSVLCEKPLALTLPDARAMVAAARSAGAVLATNHHLRNAAVHRALRRLVRDGAVGRPLAVRVAHGVVLPPRLRGWRIEGRPGGGVVLDVTVHDVDTVRFVTGLEFVEVASIGLRQGRGLGTGAGVVDAAVTVARLGEDVTVQLHDAYTIEHARTGFEVHGEEGSLIALDAMLQDPVGTLVLRRHAREDEPVDVGPQEDLYDRAVAAFARSVAGDGEPAATGEDGVRSLAVGLAVEESIRTGVRVAVASAP